jgi:hypothetical protein
MHEIWLQKYVKEHYQQIGFSRLHGPYSTGADFKGIYAGKPVKIEVEWKYSDYISHKHPPGFADILVVATLESVPEHLKERVPSIIINVNREQVIEWAQPRIMRKMQEDYYSYPWRRFSRNLFYLYAYYQKKNHRDTEFAGSSMALSMTRSQVPPGFQFGDRGIEKGFEGSPQEKALWDYWLNIAHDVADRFKLKPALLRPTWIDMVAQYLNHTGRIRDSEYGQFTDIALFIDEIILQEEQDREAGT